MKKIITYTFYVIAAIIVLFNLLSASNLSLFGYRMFRVGSGSMVPYLNVNDLVIVKVCDDYDINDIITYLDDDLYVTHRIIKKEKNGFITKGDFNNAEDDLIISKQNIVGKVVFRLKILGFFTALFVSPISWIILFACGLIITMLLPEKE